MTKQKLKRSLFMAALLCGGIFIAGTENNIHAQNGGLIGSGNDNGGYYGSGYDNGGGTLGSGTRTGEDEETNEDGSPMVGSGSRIMQPDVAPEAFWQSVWRLFI